MTLFGDRAFKGVINVRSGQKGQDFIHYNWCPYNKRNRYWGVHAQKKGHVRNLTCII